MSNTVTVKLQEALLPEASAAVQVTVVLPTGKVEPEAGVQLTVTPGQLSLAAGVIKLTSAEQWSGSVDWVMFAGQVSVGF